MNFARSLWLRGNLDGAESQYRDAVALYERLIPEAPDVLQYRQDLGRTCNNLALLLRVVGKPEEAERLGQRAVETYSELAARAPEVPEYRKALAESQMNLGVLLEAVAQVDRAEDIFRQAQEGHERLAAAFPGVPAHRAAVANALGARADLQVHEADRREARAARGALAPPVLDGRLERMAWAVGQLADRLGAAARRREAQTLLRRVVELNEALVAQLPKVPEHRANLANALNSLAQARPPDAEAITRRALLTFEALAVEQPEVVDHRKMIGVVAANLGQIQQAAGRWDDAETLYLRSVAALEPLLEKVPTDVYLKYYLGFALANRGELRLVQKSPSEAKPLLERAVGLLRVAFNANPKSPELRLALYGQIESLAHADLALGAHAEAARLAAELVPLADGPARGGLDALTVLARCAALAESDPSLPMDRRREMARAYVGRAVGVIREAITANPPVVSFEGGRPGLSAVGPFLTAVIGPPSRTAE
jgi:tetratricopeptide (TPR) repeat protein